ncbi:MAG: hypothetical protein EOP10_15895 [Proteobacteria bacterium]|nr:MAG: hypothetical protein EOP10_15895 [Pseudomonadota bacterium]
MNLAFYGTLRDRDILHHVVGESLEPYFVETRAVKGWACLRIVDQAYPLLRSDAAAVTTFDLYHETPEDCWRRLVDYEGDEYFPGELSIDGISYTVFLPENDLQPSPEEWSLETFQRRDKTQYLKDLL